MPFLAVDHFPQEEEAGCLAACTQMALSYLGIQRTQAELNQLFSLRQGGVPLSRLQRIEPYGVQVAIQSGEETHLRQAIDEGIVPFVFIRTNELSYWQTDTRHVILVVGYDEANFLIHDPAFADAPKSVNADELMLAWGEFDYLYATVTFPKSLK